MRPWKMAAVCAALAAVCAADVRLVERDARAVFLFPGWRGGERPAISVDGLQGAPPVLGAFSEEADGLVFRPRYPLQPGLSYRIVHDGKVSVLSLKAVQRQPVTRVAAIYPSTAVWPENQLKFYVEFTRPMSRGEAFQRLHLLDGQGQRIEAPFLELAEELWDPDGRRLTVLFDPGRIKRGLVPHEAAGTPLRAGGRYTIAVDAAWRDAEGVALRQRYTKEIRVVEADRTPPDPKTWQIEAPAEGTRDALLVTFPEPMDRGLLERVIRVERDRTRVPGRVEISGNETRWQFVPEASWTAGRYLLRAEAILEDLAGNRLNRPFDVDVFEAVTDRIARATEDLPFTVRSRSGR
ncbi:MAG: hypothetical protein IPM24_12250 [Bryobacterales bacterium]|nr:hypothetical protein [Bryobacterales bacterium]